MAPDTRAYSLQELAKNAAAIGVVVPTGKSQVHWNSAKGEEWVALPNGRNPMIYRDDEFTVVEAILGLRQGQSITVRGVGGTVRDVHMDYEGQIDWQLGIQYLVFLREEDTPTLEGFERAWTVEIIGQGALPGDEERFTNAAGVKVNRSDLSELATVAAP